MACLVQIAKDADYLQKNVLQPAAASNGGASSGAEKPKFFDRVKSLRTLHSGKDNSSRPPAKAVSFPSGSQVCNPFNELDRQCPGRIVSWWLPAICACWSVQVEELWLSFVGK